MALKQLVDKSQFEKLRFWGKILGTEKNYYIAEAEQNADEEVEEEEDNDDANDKDDGKDGDEEEEGDGEEDPVPKSTYKASPPVPKEERGTGVNKYTYYVCNRRMFLSFTLKIQFYFSFPSRSTMGSITYSNTSTNLYGTTDKSLFYGRFNSRNKIISSLSRNRKALFTCTNC